MSRPLNPSAQPFAPRDTAAAAATSGHGASQRLHAGDSFLPGGASASTASASSSSGVNAEHVLAGGAPEIASASSSSGMNAGNVLRGGAPEIASTSASSSSSVNARHVLHGSAPEFYYGSASASVTASFLNTGEDERESRGFDVASTSGHGGASAQGLILKDIETTEYVVYPSSSSGHGTEYASGLHAHASGPNAGHLLNGGASTSASASASSFFNTWEEEQEYRRRKIYESQFSYSSVSWELEHVALPPETSSGGHAVLTREIDDELAVEIDKCIAEACTQVDLAPGPRGSAGTRGRGFPECFAQVDNRAVRAAPAPPRLPQARQGDLKTVLCRYWPGRCTLGDSCRYAHGEGELRQVPLRPLPTSCNTRRCKFGWRCNYAPLGRCYYQH